MGANVSRKKLFLAQHPLCCFCGGHRPSAEPDHVPSRVLFDKRQWPEGFEFPACIDCNRATRHDEQVVAMLSVRGSRLNAAIENFGRKLFCALYYKHTGAILSNKGGIAIRWFTNVQIEADEIPRSLAPLLSGFPVLERSRTKLDDQFFYRWGLAKDSTAVAVFLAFFRRSFAMLGYVNRDAKDFEALGQEARIIMPYQHG